MAAAKSTTRKRAKAAAGTLLGVQRETLRLAPIRAFAEVLFDEDLHAKRVESLANGVAGVLNAAMLTIHAIGQAYAPLCQKSCPVRCPRTEAADATDAGGI